MHCVACVSHCALFSLHVFFRPSLLSCVILARETFALCIVGGREQSRCRRRVTSSPEMKTATPTESILGLLGSGLWRRQGTVSLNGGGRGFGFLFRRQIMLCIAEGDRFVSAVTHGSFQDPSRTFWTLHHPPPSLFFVGP